METVCFAKASAAHIKIALLISYDSKQDEKNTPVLVAKAKRIKEINKS